MRMRRDYDSPAMSLKQELAGSVEDEEDEEHLLISQLQATRERVEPADSILPFAVVDPKGKPLKTPSSKQKKRKKTKAFAGGAPKKAKILASTMFVARTVRVLFKLLSEFTLRTKVKIILHPF